MRTWPQLDALTGGLSEPSKMPCRAWGVPAKECFTGSALSLVEGSVCSECYAKKGRYRCPNVEGANERRLAAYKRDPWEWTHAMIESIHKTGDRYFRWFDSGDLQSLTMLNQIAFICRNTWNVKHWLPTRERGIVKRFLGEEVKPPNLVIRMGLTMIDQLPLSPRVDAQEVGGLPTSGVYVHRPSGKVCRAERRDNECGKCRACWHPSVPHVSYRLH